MKEIGTCKECRFYKEYTKEDISEGYDDWKINYGDCHNKKFYYRGGGDSPTESQKDMLTYWDCESYSAGFETGKDFGCIHWEAKDG